MNRTSPKKATGYFHHIDLVPQGDRGVRVGTGTGSGIDSQGSEVKRSGGGEGSCEGLMDSGGGLVEEGKFGF